MPWLLDSAFSPGDLDAGKSYTHLKISHLEHSVRDQFIRVYVDRGYLDGEDWMWAAVGKAQVFLIRDEPTTDPAGTDYTDLVSTVVAEGEEGDLVYDLNSAALYAYLETKGLIGAGSAV